MSELRIALVEDEEIVARRLQNDRVAEVFPGHTLRERGIVS